MEKKNYEKKYVRKTVRYKPGEYRLIRREAKEYGVTETELIRNKSLSKGVEVKEVREMDKKLLEMIKKTGNNLNQLTRKVNSLEGELDLFYQKKIYLEVIEMRKKYETIYRKMIEHDNKR